MIPEMRELRVAVIDDNYWNRQHMAQELDASPYIKVVFALHQDEAATWTREQWADVDIAVVDVFDENAPGEIGTDVYSGITALERLRDLNVKTLAVTPHRSHPLVELRIFQAGTNFVYRRWELNDPDELVQALLSPKPDHIPVCPSRSVLKKFGAYGAQANRSVRVYEQSTVYRSLTTAVGQKGLRTTRSKIDGFKAEVRDTGFVGTEDLDYLAGGTERVPRWPDVRDYLLRLLGRKDVPPTDYDGVPPTV
jgi:CheY-like chemotaxis protein